MSNGFAFTLIWNVLENGYLEPHNISRVDFNKERGRVSNFSCIQCKTKKLSNQIFQKLSGCQMVQFWVPFENLNILSGFMVLRTISITYF
jgi:hypothetical protein